MIATPECSLLLVDDWCMFLFLGDYVSVVLLSLVLDVPLLAIIKFIFLFLGYFGSE